MFGLKNVAESKISAFYESIIFYKNNNCPRIKIFGRFLKLYDSYECEELDFYLETL